MRFTQLDGVTLLKTRTRSGAVLRLSPDLDGFYLATPRVGGGIALQRSTGELRCVDADKGVAAILDRGDVDQVRYADGTEMQCFLLDADAVSAWIAARLDAPVGQPVRFVPVLSSQQGCVPVLQRLAAVVDGSLSRDAVLARSPVALQSIRDAVMSLIVGSVRSNYSERLAAVPDWSASPRILACAIDYMEAHAARPIGLIEMAAAAQCSVRAVQSAFRRGLGCTPTEHLRAVRLRQARDDLMHPAKPASVSEIARRWGFVHLGLFAKRYRAAYGELPSATLQRRLAGATAPGPADD